MLIGLLNVTLAFANCESGKLITTKAGTFCKSDIALNWWSASNWCIKNGRTLATMYDACPNWDGNQGDTCPEFPDTDGARVWTATAYSTGYASTIRDGFVEYGYQVGERYRTYQALCR